MALMRDSAVSYGVADGPETELAVAARHAAKGRCIVARQRQLIARMHAAGHPTRDAERTLDLFECTLAIFEDHERALSQSAMSEPTCRRRHPSRLREPREGP